MKTSKIIFIALLSTIALIILAAIINVRLTGKQDGEFKSEFKTRIQLSQIKSISIINNNNIELVQSDSAYFEITTMKDSIVPKLKYSITGDTLKIDDQMVKTGRGAWVSIHVNDQLNQIILKKSYLNLFNFQISQLSVDLDQSNLNVIQQNDKKNSFQRLKIIARNNSQFDATDIKIDSLQVEIYHSEISLWSTINNLRGSIADSSRLSVRQPYEITLKRDSSSNLNIN
ncbi:MAG: hypothetical protein WCP85_31465 [Mariniphaga sp.]